MIEQINDHVFRVKRTDLTHNPQEIFEQISNLVKSHHTCLISRSRDNARLNGSGKLIEDIDNDYRSHALIIVHKNRSFPFHYRRKDFTALLDRYDNLYSITHDKTGIEMMTKRKWRADLLRAFEVWCGAKVSGTLSVKFI